MCHQNHVRGDFRILWSIADMRSKWLERHKYLVSRSMDFFIVFRPSHAIVIAPSRIFNFWLIYSTIYTTWNIPTISITYKYWYLGCTGDVKVSEIWCVAYYAPSIISAAVPQFSLKYPSLTAITDPSLRAEAIWDSEDLLNVRDGFQRGIMDVGVWIIPGVWVPVDFTRDKLIDSTLIERLSSGWSWIGLSSVSINHRWLDLPWRHISGR